MRGLDFVANEARFTTLTTATRMVLWIIFLSLKLKPVALTSVLFAEGIAMHIYYRSFLKKWFRKNGIDLSGKAKLKMSESNLFLL